MKMACSRKRSRLSRTQNLNGLVCLGKN